MSTILRFPRRHARASSETSRAASLAKRSSVRPAALARSVDRTTGHHFEGMLSRLNHLITAQFPAPTSAAIASRDSQRSMTERNDVGGESGMPELLGQYVPSCKTIMSHDFESPVGHSVPMTEDPEKLAESVWREAFRQRLRDIQGKRTQEDMADLLGISRDTWNKCVNRGDTFPIRKLPRLAKLAQMSVEELIGIDRPTEKIAAAPRRARSSKQRTA